ncbi:MAG: response regulator transcription factor [Alphaproteobacteria bacterium]|nr:MAG: response regulator transcription factor [Alphaproteobacteria bacterium]
MYKATVLTVDDDENLQVVMRQYLEQNGYQFISALNGAELMSKLDLAHPDIILLDLGLPDQDGLSLLTAIRSKCRAPVIVVSGKNETADRIVGLEMGADDYLTKPFEMRELSARIKAVLRRSAGAEKQPAGEAENKAKRLAFSGWVLDRLQYQLFDKDGMPADLTSGEFKLLEALVVAPNRVLSREQLFELTRQGEFDVYDRVIDIQIARIRKKLSDDPQNPSLIKTVRGVGYMFCGEAKPVD